MGCKKLLTVSCKKVLTVQCKKVLTVPCKKLLTMWLQNHLTTHNYPKKQLEDFSRYVFGVPYTVIQEALQRKDVMKHGRNACAD